MAQYAMYGAHEACTDKSTTASDQVLRLVLASGRGRRCRCAVSISAVQVRHEWCRKLCYNLLTKLCSVSNFTGRRVHAGARQPMITWFSVKVHGWGVSEVLLAMLSCRHFGIDGDDDPSVGDPPALSPAGIAGVVLAAVIALLCVAGLIGELRSANT
jgi:hypothetical protein